MSSSGSPPDKNRMSYGAIGGQALTVGGEVGCVTVVIVLVAVLGGLWLDRTLGTKAAFTIFLVLASAPISLFLTVWIARKSIKQTTPPPSTKAGGNTKAEGEKTGE
jgi:hypothetical protein